MEDLPIPLSRVELYLAKIAGMDVTIPEEPMSRLEQFLAVLAGDAGVEMPTPLSLTEQWLSCVYYGTISNHPAVEGAHYIDNQKVDTRYLAVASGVVGMTLPPAPQNRKEQYWAVIATAGPIHGVLKYVTGSDLTLTDVVSGIEDLEFIYGDTFQQSYGGWQLLKKDGLATPTSDSDFWYDLGGGLSISSLGGGWARFTKSADGSQNFFIGRDDGFTWEVNTIYTVIIELRNTPSSGGVTITQPGNAQDPFATGGQVGYDFDGLDHTYAFSKTTKSSYSGARGLRPFIRSATPEGTSVDMRITIIAGNHTSDYQNYVGNNYEPYIGGIPAPNPDYPQDIEVATGEQTITVAGGETTNTYTINLGNLELCKIGDYQDYIYKSGNDWYFHKETGKDTLPTSGYTQWDVANNVYWQNYQPSGCLFSNSVTSGITRSLIAVTQHDYITGVNSEFTEKGLLYGFGLKTKTKGVVIKNNDITTLAAFHTWIAANPIDLYYPLATPTDTQITDATLISQLNALDAAVLPKPVAYITVGAASGNLPAPLKISYYGRAE